MTTIGVPETEGATIITTPSEKRLHTMHLLRNVPHSCICVTTGREFENFSQASEQGHYVGDSRNNRTKLRKAWAAGDKDAFVQDNEGKAWKLKESELR